MRNRKLSLMSILEGIAKENKKGKMIALFVPKILGSQLQKMFSHVPGEMVEPEDMHITLGLMRGNEEEDRKVIPILKDLAANFDPFDMKIAGFGKFPPNEHNHMKHVLWAKPDGETIGHLHDTLFDLFKKHNLPIDNGSFDFNPHITIKYCDEEPEIDQKLDNPVFRVKHMSLASGGKKFHAPFRGEM